MKFRYKICAVMLLLAMLAGCAKREQPADVEPTPTPTVAPTPEPTPEPTPAPQANPLTGEEGAYANKRPVAVTLRTLTGSEPLWGIERAGLLIEGVTEGTTPTLMAVFADAAEISKVGPVGPGRDLTLQFALPLNAVPVHIDKNIYASNLLNALQYQDLDGYHIGKAAFAFDDGRQAAGYLEENCWYTTAALVQSGLQQYAATTEGPNTPLFRFGQRPAVAEADRNAAELVIGFSQDSAVRMRYNAETGLYQRFDGSGNAVLDADNGAQPAFANVVVLYAASGIKDDGYTRQYDMSGGTGLYLNAGRWEEIRWSKEDATAPLVLTDLGGAPLTVATGKCYLAVWGGYYGQTIELYDAAGNAQPLPAKPALLESGVPDDVAAAAYEEFVLRQRIVDARAALSDAEAELPGAQQALEEALQARQQNPGEAADALVAERQAAVDEWNRIIEENRPIVEQADAAAAAAAAAAGETPPAEG